MCSPFEVRWDKYEDDLWDSWYIQHAKVLPSSTILAMLGEKARDILKDATPATEDEIRASALQFVRKLSGFARPSRANEAAFNRAVDAVTEAAHDLLASLVKGNK